MKKLYEEYAKEGFKPGVWYVAMTFGQSVISLDARLPYSDFVVALENALMHGSFQGVVK